MDKRRFRTTFLTLTPALGALLLVLLCTAALAWPAGTQAGASGPQSDLECMDVAAAAGQPSVAVRGTAGPGTGSEGGVAAAVCAPLTAPDAAPAAPVEAVGSEMDGEIMLQTAVSGTAIAFVYAQDLAVALSFESFLESGGYSVTLVLISDVLATDLSAVDAVMVGHDTGNLDEWPLGVKGTSAEADYIEATGVPVIGLGEGGYAFFGKLGLPIGSPYGWHGELKGVQPSGISSSFWQTPTAITLPAGAVNLYTANVPEVGIYLKGLSDVVPLGLESDDDVHAPLVGLKDSPHQLWGFNGTPEQMTKTGKALFGNAVVFSLIHPDGLPPDYPVFLPAVRK